MALKILVIVVLIGVIFIIFGSTLNNPFYWDDEGLIVNNYALRTPLNFKNYFFSNPIPQRPLVTFSFAIDYSLFGLKPFGYHITQIILHILNTVLVFYIAYLIFKNKWVSVFSGAVFAFHPIHTEALDLFLGRSDLLCSLFFLTSFLFYIKFTYSTGDRSKLFFYFSLISFTLALLSKEMAAVFPLVIIIYDRLMVKSSLERLSHRYTHYIPYFLLSLCYVLFWYLVLRGGFSEGGKSASMFKLWGGSIYSTFLMELVVLKKYIGLLFLPIGLSGWYEIPVYTPIVNREIFLSIIFFTLLVFLCFYKLKKELVFPVLWFFITILPISNLIPIPGSMMAERWLYIPSVGFSFFSALIVVRLIDSADLKNNKIYKRLIPFIIILVLALYCTASYIRNLDFANEHTFFKKLYEANPSSRLIRSNLGLAYLRKDMANEAVVILEPLAKEMKGPFLQLIFNNLGGAYEKKGDLSQAERLYEAAIKLKPDYIDARLNLGALYLNGGRMENAMKEFEEVIKIDPLNPNAHYNLGLLYDALKKYDDSISHYKESIKMRPDLPDVHNNLGLDYLRKGMTDLALEECKKAIQIDPKYFQAYGNLGLIYLQQGRKDLALKSFKRVLELDPNSTLAKEYIKEATK